MGPTMVLLQRYIIAAAFPLFIPQIYVGLGIAWATSLIGLLSLMMGPIPFENHILTLPLLHMSRQWDQYHLVLPTARDCFQCKLYYLRWENNIWYCGNSGVIPYSFSFCGCINNAEHFLQMVQNNLNERAGSAFLLKLFKGKVQLVRKIQVHNSVARAAWGTRSLRERWAEFCIAYILAALAGLAPRFEGKKAV